MTASTLVNYYELLQVEPSATSEEIQAAVRKQRRQWIKRQASADPTKRAEAEVKVRQIDEAEKTLLDAASRSAFDHWLANYRPPQPTTADPASDDWQMKAEAYLKQGNISAAHTIACEAINQRGADHHAWYIRAHASFLMGQSRNAEYEFAEAIRLQPGEPDYHFELGDVYAGQAKWPDAIREYEAALRFEPKSPAFRTAIAEAYCASYQTGKAVEIMEGVVAEYPHDELFRFYLALALHENAIQSMSFLLGGHLPTSENQVLLAEKNASRIEILGLNDHEAREWATDLKELARNARKPYWVRGDSLKYYLIGFVFILAILPALAGGGFMNLVGFVGAGLIVWLYVYRHRKPTWQHRSVALAHDIVRPGI